ncbi:MAG: hypothetical protein LBR66_04110 [Candidatus Symbiothrix sp.]|jgi:hypothetical protein|nr:hypothetical protein [Candidatus Symbiothrix sp.]
MIQKEKIIKYARDAVFRSKNRTVNFFDPNLEKFFKSRYRIKDTTGTYLIVGLKGDEIVMVGQTRQIIQHIMFCTGWYDGYEADIDKIYFRKLQE